MHLVVHYGIRLGFVAVVAILFALLVSVRPGAKGRPSNLKIVGMLCVGLVIAGIFMMTTALYAPPPGQ